MKIYISQELGSAYQLIGDSLEFAPLMKDGTFETNDFGATEPELMGEEPVTFEGVETNFYGAYATIIKRLKGEL